MAKSLSGILQILASKAGLDTTNPGVQSLLKGGDNVDDIIYESVEKFLNEAMTLESAKHNPALLNHFKSQILLPVDSEIKNIIEAYGLSPDDAFNGERSSYKKIGMLASMIRSAEEEKRKSSGGDKAALQKEIDRLNAEMVATKKAHEASLASVRTQAEEQILSSVIDAYLSNKNYAESIPKGIRVSGARELLKAELANVKAKIVRSEDGTLRLVNSENPDLNYTHNNAPVAFDSFVDGLLAKNAMLKVSTPQPGAGGGVRIPPNPDGGKVVAQQVSDFNNSQIEALEKSGA